MVSLGDMSQCSSSGTPLLSPLLVSLSFEDEENCEEVRSTSSAFVEESLFDCWRKLLLYHQLQKDIFSPE